MKLEKEMDQNGFNLKDFETETVSLKELFITRAIEDFVISLKYNRFVNEQPNNILRHRYAISSVIFSFLSIDNIINYYYKELFVHTYSKMFLKEEDRPFFMKQSILNWRHKSVIDRFTIIYYTVVNDIPASNLMGRLAEFGTFRNLLVHGYSYQRDLLLDTTYGENCAWQEVADYEDIHEGPKWEKRFPLLKFNTPDSVWVEDAEKSLTVMFDCIAPILKITKDEFSIDTLKPRIQYYTLKYETCSFKKLLDEIPADVSF